MALVSEGSILWDISKEIKELRCEPTGVIYVSALDILLLADFEYGGKISVLSPDSGQIIQAIFTEYSQIENLHLIGNRLLIQHHNGYAALSYCRVSVITG